MLKESLMIFWKPVMKLLLCFYVNRMNPLYHVSTDTLKLGRSLPKSMLCSPPFYSSTSTSSSTVSSKLVKESWQILTRLKTSILLSSEYLIWWDRNYTAKTFPPSEVCSTLSMSWTTVPTWVGSSNSWGSRVNWMSLLPMWWSTTSSWERSSVSYNSQFRRWRGRRRTTTPSVTSSIN